MLREREEERRREVAKGDGKMRAKGRGARNPSVADGGSDLAKLKSLLYGHTGKIGYTPGGSRWNFEKASNP